MDYEISYGTHQYITLFSIKRLHYHSISFAVAQRLLLSDIADI